MNSESQIQEIQGIHISHHLPKESCETIDTFGLKPARSATGATEESLAYHNSP